MKKILLFLLLPITLRASAQQKTSARHWQDTVNAIETILARYHAQNPGCELAISRNGHVIFSKAWGMADLEHHVRLTTTSITEAGSVSKQFTAAAILLLEQQGKLSLDDDVAKYIPELPEYGRPIPLRYLMHHTSGIRDWGAIAAIAGWPRTTRTYNNNDALDIIAHQQELNFTPNDDFGYSNSNYNLFAIIVERVSGMSLAEFTRKYIFIPAGMTHTGWRDDHKRVVPNRAIAYDLTGGVYETNMPNEDVYGNGGLLTTAEDLLKWNAWYQGGHFGNPSLLPRQLQIDTFNNGQPIGYAAGLFIAKKHDLDYVSHDGATASYRARLASYPALHLSIAWLSNTSAFDGAVNVAVQVEDLFLPKIQVVATKITNDDDHVFHAVIMPKDSTVQTYIRSYVGRYYSEEAQTTFDVQLKFGQLYLYRSPQTLIPMNPSKKDVFVTVGPGFGGEPGEVRFVPEKDGTYRRMLISISRSNNVVFNRL
jgi:CubicO group peptidase (beta-lactamase class C family)